MKHQEGVLHYLATGKRFILLRRWHSDLTTLWIEKYFSDVDVFKITEGKYNSITVWRKVLYFSNVDENQKVIRGEKIGYVVALSGEQHFSGGSFLDVDRIIFEEFMERGIYISQEPSKLMAFYSTVDRKRGETKLYLVGNTISRVNPYLHEWNLQNIVRNMKQGEIKTLIIKNDDTDVKIAIEYCKSSGGKKLAIGSSKNMIDSGNWQSLPQPKLDSSIKNFEKIYRIGFQYQSFKFIAELLSDSKNLFWFIFPYTKDFSNNIIVFSDVVSVEKNWQKDVYNITIKNNRLQNLLNTFRETNIFYSDDLTGTDFKQVIDFKIKK